MGEVYRARDTRLGRVVAITVVPPIVADHPDTLARFEREAQSVAMLSHPNILALHDVGRADGISYAVMELLEGETLRSRLASGALPQRKAVEIAAQIARGLAAAHEKHIAHRDLKPENIFITTDGQVKILDFGLARYTDALRSDPARADGPTMAPLTGPGVVLGTVSYMAPEQARGHESDYRADIFALGCVLYEMLTGRRAYERDSAPETMTAILKEDPPHPSTLGVVLAPAVQRIVSRCLEKRPEERFQSTRDLVFALESSLDASATNLGSQVLTTGARRWRLIPALALGVVVGASAVFFLPRNRPARAETTPTFRQLTFERGTIRDARFTPDGRSVLYGAAWEGNPLRVFTTRTDSPESVRLSLPDARLLSIARTGEIAISLGHAYEGWIGAGTLARSSVLGSAPRVLADAVREAEWTPDATALAIARRVGALDQLEFPIGRALYKTSGFINDLRFSPDGERMAFADHPQFADDAGAVAVIDRAGQRTVLSEGYISVTGVAWSPDGKEVWFTARRGGVDIGDGVYAVTLDGHRRVVWPSPTDVKLFDVAPDGRVLLGHQVPDRRVEALLAGASAPIDVSLRAASTSQWISDDGSSITITDQASATYSAYLQRAGGAAVPLGDGQAYGVSPDGRWALALPVNGSSVMLHPTGAGESRNLPNPQKLVIDAVAWLPNGRRVVMFGQPQGQAPRGYVQDIGGGEPRPFTPEGVGSLRWWMLPVSPDGSRVVARGVDGKTAIYKISDGTSEGMRGLNEGDVPVRWTADGRGLFVAHGNGLPWIVERLDVATGRRTPALEIRARDASGLRLSLIGMSPDGRHYVHSYSRLLTELFVVQGLR